MSFDLPNLPFGWDFLPLESCARPNLQPLIREINWAKDLVFLARSKDAVEHEFDEF